MTRAPRATYRVQLGKSFPLDSVAAIVPYLASLGISHVYLSPLFRARAGSLHGYDVVDPNEVSPELGGIDALRRLADVARAAGLGLILDVVPNHMAASPENRWFADVLEGGMQSPFARFFDIEWDARRAATGGRIVLPLLDEPLDDAIARGRFAVLLDDAGLVVTTPCGTLPLAPSTWEAVFAPGRVRLSAALGAGAAEVAELDSFLASAATLRADVKANAFGDLEALHVARRRTVAKFRAAMETWPLLATFVTERLSAVNSESERDRLAALIDSQRWRLVCWKDAKGARNFRRYADIDDLIAMDVDDEHVFRATHGLALGLVADGVASGLRVDHVDGLADPARYLTRLARGVRPDSGLRPWIAAEHFVSPGKAPPAEFGVPATTGYDFLAAITRFQSHAPGVARLSALAAESGVAPIDAVAARREMLDTLLFDERDRLVDRFGALAARSPSACELSRDVLDRAVVALTARLRGGRTFVRPGHAGAADVLRIKAAGRAAESDADPRALEFVVGTLTSGAERDWPFARRWQQLCAAVGAKAIEDTLVYRDHRALAFAELGLAPLEESPAMSIEEFRAFAADRARSQPDTLNATSTHDTKWSEDARARLAVLSEIPDEFAAAAREALAFLNCPDPRFGWRALQTLVGCWPVDGRELPGFRERLRAHVVKAVREAKEHSSWIAPNLALEAVLCGFVETMFAAGPGSAFRERLHRLLDRVACFGAWNSLTSALLKIALPGIPDIYQGLESWAFHFVDPDNRRAVDFGALAQRLADLDLAESREGPLATARSLIHRWPDGALKQWITSRALRVRKRFAPTFARGAFVPCAIDGAASEHVFAFERRLEDTRVLVVVGRWFARLVGDRTTTVDGAAFRDATLVVPPYEGARNPWVDALTGAVHEDEDRIPVARLFAHLPLALLVRSE